MTAPRQRSFTDPLTAALCSAGAAAMFLLMAWLSPLEIARPFLLGCAALTAVCAWRAVR